MTQAWAVRRAGDTIILSRPGRDRLDLYCETVLPPLRPVVVAHEIRKDLWRCLRRVRGFSPVVALRSDPDGLRVKAGGMLCVPRAPRTWIVAALAGLLDTPEVRSRWIAHARLP